jgi:hypothetical protein
MGGARRQDRERDPRLARGGRQEERVMDALKLMRAWFPAWTDEQRHDVLWNCTAYPCGGKGFV